jgi:hypothetical protein
MLLLPAAAAWGAESEHPVIKPVPGSLLNENLYVYKDMDAFPFPVSSQADPAGMQFRMVKGKKWFLPYVSRKPGAEETFYSEAEIIQHYKGIAGERKGAVLYEERNRMYFTVPGIGNAVFLCYVWVSDLGYYNLLVIEEQASDEKERGEERPWRKRPEEGAESANEPSRKLHGLLQEAEYAYLGGNKAAAVETLQRAVASITEELPLSARNVRFVTDTKTYGTRRSNIFAPGEPVRISCLLTGHGFRKMGDRYEIDVTTDFLVIAVDGRVLGSREDAFRFSNASSVPAAEFSMDLTYVFSDIPRGTYTIHTILKDKLSGKRTQFANDIVIR